jgi:uncharacterized protein
MTRVDPYCYPGTDVWITSQGPYAEALGKYWGRTWPARSEQVTRTRRYSGRPPGNP